MAPSQWQRQPAVPGTPVSAHCGQWHARTGSERSITRDGPEPGIRLPWPCVPCKFINVLSARSITRACETRSYYRLGAYCPTARSISAVLIQLKLRSAVAAMSIPPCQLRSTSHEPTTTQACQQVAHVATDIVKSRKLGPHIALTPSGDSESPIISCHWASGVGAIAMSVAPARRSIPSSAGSIGVASVSVPWTGLAKRRQ
jgi:hypothetical protein